MFSSFSFFVFIFLTPEYEYSSHAKSARLLEHHRAVILQQVKLALAWKSVNRKPDEIAAKVSEVNAFMGKIVSEL